VKQDLLDKRYHHRYASSNSILKIIKAFD